MYSINFSRLSAFMNHTTTSSFVNISSESSGEILRDSRASFGMTICQREPTFTEPCIFILWWWHAPGCWGSDFCKSLSSVFGGDIKVWKVWKVYFRWVYYKFIKSKWFSSFYSVRDYSERILALLSRNICNFSSLLLFLSCYESKKSEKEINKFCKKRIYPIIKIFVSLCISWLFTPSLLERRYSYDF